MSLIDYGVANGVIEKTNSALTIYPKRALNSGVLRQTIDEAFKEGYDVIGELNYSKPIVMKKKDKIDFTEVCVKLFGVALRYGIDFKINTNREAGIINFYTMYEDVNIEKTFDVEMLCTLEDDYITSWIESKLQSIDERKTKL